MGDFMFERVINLIGKEKINSLQNKKILIVGLGGVGGYAFETLVRSGIKYIDIIDFDKIDISNLNRQIITNRENIGLLKVNETKKRGLSINPDLVVNTYNVFLDKNNINEILSNNYDYIIDACDSVDTKIELIKYSINNDIKLISSMGTAKKLDPTKLSITTLDKTEYDPLARRLRKIAKEEKINGKIYVVSSNEKALECENLGTLMMVPATAGILCAKFVIDDIIK